MCLGMSEDLFRGNSCGGNGVEYRKMFGRGEVSLAHVGLDVYMQWL